MKIDKNDIIQKYGILLLMVLGMVGMVACSHDPEGPSVPDELNLPIRFGSMSMASAESSTRAEQKNLEDALKELNSGTANYVPTFRVWCYKTMKYDESTYNYTEPRTVMDRFIVKWIENSAGSTTTNTHDWEYVGVPNEYLGEDVNNVPYTQDVRYWDNNSTSYRFFGFAPSDALAGQTNYTYPADHGDGYQWFDITFPADAAHPEQAPYVSKLWFSNGNPTDYPNHQYGTTVQMQFLKPITKVRIELFDAYSNKITEPSTIGFTALKFAPASGNENIVQKGKLRVSYAVTGPATVAYYTPTVEIIGDESGTVTIPASLGENYTDYVYVLPHVTQGDYRLTAMIGEKQKLATVPAQYMSWHPNMEYTYRFRMTDDEFQFIDVVQIGVTEWQTVTDSHNIYNW